MLGLYFEEGLVGELQEVQIHCFRHLVCAGCPMLPYAWGRD